MNFSQRATLALLEGEGRPSVKLVAKAGSGKTAVQNEWLLSAAEKTQDQQNRTSVLLTQLS